MHALISSKYICIYISTYVFIDLTTKNTYLLCKKIKKIYLPRIIRRPNPLTLIKFTTFICLILTVQKLVSIVSNHADQITDKIDCIIEMNIVQYQLAYIYTQGMHLVSKRDNEIRFECMNKNTSNPLSIVSGIKLCGSFMYYMRALKHFVFIKCTLHPA